MKHEDKMDRLKNLSPENFKKFFTVKYIIAVSIV